MAPLGWATAEERSFLVSLIPEYQACQVKRRYKGFWQRANVEFLSKFPVINKLFPGMKVADLTPEQKQMYTVAVLKQQQRIKEWFRWQLNPRSRNSGTAPTRRGLNHGPGRPLNTHEAPTAICAKDVEDVEGAQPTHGISGGETPLVGHGEAMQPYRVISKGQKEAMRLELNDGMDMDVSALPGTSPQEYLRYFKELPALVDSIVTPGVVKAGVLALVTIVEPGHEQDGEIVSKRIQCGDKPGTPSFSEVSDGQDAVFIKELTRFARKHEFPPEVCASRALKASPRSPTTDESDDACPHHVAPQQYQLTGPPPVEGEVPCTPQIWMYPRIGSTSAQVAPFVTGTSALPTSRSTSSEAPPRPCLLPPVDVCHSSNESWFSLRRGGSGDVDSPNRVPQHPGSPTLSPI